MQWYRSKIFKCAHTQKSKMQCPSANTQYGVIFSPYSCLICHDRLFQLEICPDSSIHMFVFVCVGICMSVFRLFFETATFFTENTCLKYIFKNVMPQIVQLDLFLFSVGFNGILIQVSFCSSYPMNQASNEAVCYITDLCPDCLKIEV